MNTAVGCANLNNEARATGSTPHTTGTASGNIAGLPLANLLNRCGGADLAGGSSPSPLTARILGRADCSEHTWVRSCSRRGAAAGAEGEEGVFCLLLAGAYTEVTLAGKGPECGILGEEVREVGCWFAVGGDCL